MTFDSDSKHTQRLTEEAGNPAVYVRMYSSFHHLTLVAVNTKGRKCFRLDDFTIKAN